MSYIEKVADLAAQIKNQADEILALKKERESWVRPKSKAIHLGRIQHWVVRDDGTVTPGFEGIQREAIKMHDAAIFDATSRLEGLRYQLAKLGKVGEAV